MNTIIGGTAELSAKTPPQSPKRARNLLTHFSPSSACPRVLFPGRLRLPAAQCQTPWRCGSGKRSGEGKPPCTYVRSRVSGGSTHTKNRPTKCLTASGTSLLITSWKSNFSLVLTLFSLTRPGDDSKNTTLYLPRCP